ncbi:MAG TPA: hypothetical protein VGA02_13785 [Gemmatimonadales bacterium]|jgi:hypothetical protein
MVGRTVEIAGEAWQVSPSGRVTSYQRDEFGLVFQRGSGGETVRRFVRYSPLGSRRWDAALAELTDRELRQLFACSQIAWTSPDARLSPAPAGRGGR